MKKPLRIAVDFDATIVFQRYPAIGPLVPGAIETLKLLTDAGHKLILWTCRTGRDLQRAMELIQAEGIPLHGVNSNQPSDRFSSIPKVWADHYIDDASVGAFLRTYAVDGSFETAIDWQRVRSYFLSIRAISGTAMNMTDAFDGGGGGP